MSMSSYSQYKKQHIKKHNGLFCLYKNTYNIHILIVWFMIP